MRTGLTGMRVVEIAEQIAGPYCGKLLVDAGADVIKIERPGGDPLRRWTASGADPGARDSPLFTFLNAGKRSVVGTVADPHVTKLLAEADLVIVAHGLAGEGPARIDVAGLCTAHPALVVLAMTPYGLEGPWAARQATEFTLQAESGSIGMRGVLGEEPFQAGGRIGEWSAGVYGAMSCIPSLMQARTTGRGLLIDLSLLEAANMVFTQFSDSMNRLMNGRPDDPPMAFLMPSVETPSVEPTADGYVGFCTNARQQFLDFLLLIERPDLQEDETLLQVPGRMMRFAEWNAIVRAWTTRHTTAEIVERASLLRIPVAPIGNGQTLPDHEQLTARGVFVRSANGRFLQPRRPYRIDDVDPPSPRPAPTVGAHTATAAFSSARAHLAPASAGPLPLAGLRVVDLTAWWAGPSATHALASFGAEVIHVESAGRPDGVRMVGGMMSSTYGQWWEACPHFLHANSNKLGITLDLDTPTGRDLLERLIARCDAVVENFTPRVLENFGFGWEQIRALNPRAILMRMPAFGLSGPWRDHTGFAQTMEQFSGMAWITGHAADQPRIPRGPCDPLAGTHAAFALLVALTERAASGRGHLVESTMVESALNVAAEQVLEWTASGELLCREGNRSPLAAPQGLYPCAGGQPGMENWLALAVTEDAAWRTLRTVLGDPPWAADPALDSHVGRRAAHDRIDEHLRAWTRTRELGPLVAELRGAGIIASEVANPCRLLETNPQLRARRYFEAPEHPVVGAMPLPSWPFRVDGIERWLRTPAPTLGQDNARVLCGLLGIPAGHLHTLEAEGVIGTRPRGL